MAIRVIMERIAKEGRHQEVMGLLRQLRAKAVFQPGYISGETLRDPQDPCVNIVISTWRSLQDWKAWENNPQRMEMVSKLEELLIAPTKTSVYTQVEEAPYAK